MDEFNFFYFIILLIVIIQSIVGVGVLVIGTPFFLFLNFEMITIISILLPISLFTSFINRIIIENNKKYEKIKIDKSTKKNFFLLCLPAIFIGLIFLNFFKEKINFKILVAVIIFFSVICKILYKRLFFLHNHYTSKIVMFVSGIIHGLSNSGGTLLLIFINLVNRGMIRKNRLSMNFFYFYLVLFQYLIFLAVFNKTLKFEFDIFLLILILLGVILGNFLEKYIKISIFENLVNLMALTAAVSLILSA